jgi:ABC-type dipeptide/oligopeptide/nickel transport system ATPase component
VSLLSINNLSVQVGQTPILRGVSLDIVQGAIVGVVGGSGSGKTTLGMSILGLLPDAMQKKGGSIHFDGQNITDFSLEQMRQLRGNEIGMIFQEPLSAFDPLFTIGQQLDETLIAHKDMSPASRREHIISTLKSVELDDSERIYKSYPHELSGGLRQRAMIAQAIICNPKLVIADEPTSSLDVTIQAKVMKLLRKLNKERGMAILLISHDLGLVGHLADEIAVMTEGKIVEQGKTAAILQKPAHHYTKSLIEAY